MQTESIIIRRKNFTIISVIVLVVCVLSVNPEDFSYLFYTSVCLLTAISLYGIVLRIIGSFYIYDVGNCRIVSYAPLPNPGNTMISHIARNGYQVDDILSLDVMVCDLSNKYIKSFIALLKEKNNDVKINLCGKGSIDYHTRNSVFSVKLFLKR